MCFSRKGKISDSYTINLRRHPASTLIAKPHRELAFLHSRTEFKAHLHPPPQSGIFTRIPIMYRLSFNFTLWKPCLTFYFGTPWRRTHLTICTALSGLLHVCYKERDGRIPVKSSWGVWILWRLEFRLITTAIGFWPKINGLMNLWINGPVQKLCPR